jgi:hypothetical protein
MESVKVLMSGTRWYTKFRPFYLLSLSLFIKFEAERAVRIVMNKKYAKLIAPEITLTAKPGLQSCAKPGPPSQLADFADNI